MVQIPNESLVLVAYLPTPRDLEIARILGWYRIPLRTTPKMIEVDYFAFYQGGKFYKEHRWRIEFAAKYQGHELTTRAELLRDEQDHPRAHEEYLKVQLGPMMQLEKPIVADKWKRLTFLFTTGELFNSANVLNDLLLDEPDREMLWKSLRERVISSHWYRAKSEQNEISKQELVNWLSVLNKEWRETDFSDY